MEGTAEANSPNLVPMGVDSLHRKGGKGKKGKGKVKNKVTETDITAKVKVNKSNSDMLTDIATSVVRMDTRIQTVQARANSSMTCVTNVEHMDTRELTVFLKTVTHLESESVTGPNEEPADIESLELLHAWEHDGEEAMASLADAPVRLLLDGGSGVSACLLILPLM